MAFLAEIAIKRSFDATLNLIKTNQFITAAHQLRIYFAQRKCCDANDKAEIEYWNRWQ